MTLDELLAAHPQQGVPAMPRSPWSVGEAWAAALERGWLWRRLQPSSDDMFCRVDMFLQAEHDTDGGGP